MHSLLFSIIFLATTVNVGAQVLITNTTVIDVENKKLIHSQNVLIQDGIITAIGTNVSPPVGSQVIDGNGKYLVPGFVDTHVHFFQSGGVFTRPDVIDLRKFKPYADEIAWTHDNMENRLRCYVKAGITTVVDVGSTVNFLKQRETFRNKDFAPAIYMTGPLLTTRESSVYKGLLDDEPFYEMKTVEETRIDLQKQLANKPDFIKIGYLISGHNVDSVARSFLPLVTAAIEEAHRLGLRVAVHATERITAQLAVEAGADHLVHVPIDELIEPEFVALLKKKNVVVSSSTIVFEGYWRTFGQRYVPNQHDADYAHPVPLQSVIDFKHLPDTALTQGLYRRTQRNAARASRNDSTLRLNLKRLVDGGVTVATATDAGNIGTQHVASYFQELTVMQQSGLNLWQLLQSSTINGARAVGKESEFGSIKKGKRADMLLLTKNPLESLTNWRSIEWIINKGTVSKPDICVTR